MNYAQLEAGLSHFETLPRTPLLLSRGRKGSPSPSETFRNCNNTLILRNVFLMAARNAVLDNPPSFLETAEMEQTMNQLIDALNTLDSTMISEAENLLNIILSGHRRSLLPLDNQELDLLTQWGITKSETASLIRSEHNVKSGTDLYKFLLPHGFRNPDIKMALLMTTRDDHKNSDAQTEASPLRKSKIKP